MKRTLTILLALFLCLCFGGCGDPADNFVKDVGELLLDDAPVPPAGYYVAMVTADQESFGGKFDPGAGWLRIYEDGTGELSYQEVIYQVTTDEANLYLNGKQISCQYVKQKIPYAEIVVLVFTDQSTDTRHTLMLYAMPAVDN